MLNRSAQDWERLCHLAALLKELPSLAEELGFRYYSFTFSSPAQSISTGNLLAGGQPLVQAALQSRPAHLRSSNIPLTWDAKAFTLMPSCWPTAQALGLRHGWIQPLHQGATRSSLALFRPHVSTSIAERYEKTAQAMWLGERLHLAALRDAQVNGAHAPCAPFHEAQDPAVNIRSSGSHRH